MNEIAYKKKKTLKYQSKQKIKFSLIKPIFFTFTSAAAFFLDIAPKPLLKCSSSAYLYLKMVILKMNLRLCGTSDII